jgi:hypothetical protein
MSLQSLASSPTSTPVSNMATRAERPDANTSVLGSTLSTVADSAAAGLSATVSFSGKALHALEQAGEAVVEGVEDLAVGAWHGVESAARATEHAGEAVADAIGDGIHEVVADVKTAARDVGHYAAVGLETLGDATSELASGSVLAASAVGKTVMAMV